MKSIRLVAVVGMISAFLLLDSTARAAFHLMQIEQVIGGVNGDTTAQAIQLRMRNAVSQANVAVTRIRAWDAAGANPVVVSDIPTNVPNGGLGVRILLTTAAFGTYTNVPLVSDFTLINPIPASYLPAGRLTFETDNGALVYWSLAWGGAGYTGSNAGTLDNDADGNFGPPFAGALPSSSTSALLINRTSSQGSTNNAANYSVPVGAATFTNNAGSSFIVTVPPPPPDSADFNNDDDVDGDDFLTWQLNTGAAGTFAQGDANHNGTINGSDLAVWETQYNTPPPLSAFGAAPEPSALALALCGLAALGRRRARR